MSPRRPEPSDYWRPPDVPTMQPGQAAVQAHWRALLARGERQCWSQADVAALQARVRRVRRAAPPLRPCGGAVECRRWAAYRVTSSAGSSWLACGREAEAWRDVRGYTVEPL